MGRTTFDVSNTAEIQGHQDIDTLPIAGIQASILNILWCFFTEMCAV